MGEWVDAGVILGVVVVNAVVGHIQEGKAQKAIGALSRMLVTMATVRRDGVRLQLNSEQLVPGDVVWIQSGDRVPADLRLVAVKGLRCDESALTGESVPSSKDVGLLDAGTVVGDRRNMAHAGTWVTQGQAEGVVV
jgi:P-type E1-E2 ATPase